MKNTVYFFIILVFSFYTGNSSYAYSPSAEVVEYESRLPLHGMFIESEDIRTDITVKNNLDAKRHYIVKVDFELISDTPQIESREVGFDLESFEKDTDGFVIQLSPGNWKRVVQLYENSTDRGSIDGWQDFIVVQPIQNYYNLLIAIGTIITGVVSATALVTNIKFSRKHVKHLENQINDQRKERHLTQKPVLAFALNFMGNRLNLNCKNIGNGLAKNIELIIKTEGEQSVESKLKITRNGLAKDDHFIISNLQKTSWVGIGGYDFDCEISGLCEDIFGDKHKINEKFHFSSEP